MFMMIMMMNRLQSFLPPSHAVFTARAMTCHFGHYSHFMYLVTYLL